MKRFAVEIEQAKTLVKEGKADCVLINEGVFLSLSGRGIGPLLNFYQTHRSDMCGGCIVDKVAGKAAAFIGAAGKVAVFYALTMSQSAVALLNAYGIDSDCETLAEKIINRAGTGPCPMEKAVADIREPDAAVAKIEETLENLRRGA